MLKRWLSYIVCIGLLVVAMPMIVLGEEVEVGLPEGKEERVENLQDEDFSTRVTLKRGEEVRVQFSEGAVAYLEIYEVPALLKVDLLDETGVVLETRVLENPDHMVTMDVGGAKGILLWAPEEGWSLSTLKICGEEFVAPLKAESEADMLVLLARTGDEWKLGGLLPQYAGENGLKVKVAYALEGDAYGDFCGLRTLVDMGVGVYPVFMGLKDKSVANYNQALTALGGEKVLLRELVRLLWG